MKPIGKLIIEKENHFLLIHYLPKTEYVLYDLCDINGKICLSGKIEVEPPTKANIQGLPEGDYQLFIIDGEKIVKQALKI